MVADVVCVCLCAGGCTLQVVHEAYRRFTEESLMQSVCDKPSESTEVTIKVSTRVQRCTLHYWNVRMSILLDHNQKKMHPMCQIKKWSPTSGLQTGTGYSSQGIKKVK